VTKKRQPKQNVFRCHICQFPTDSLRALKDHLTYDHELDADDELRTLASNILANPQPGTSRDFSDWTAVRIQPRRNVTRRQRFGVLKKSTKEFSNWK
jgi:hypothetical protein